MDSHITEFFSHFGAGDEGPKGHFHEVIALHEHPEIAWGEVVEMLPQFPRGWFELSKLPPEDRVSFTAEYWLSKLPYHPFLSEYLTAFFQSLDDIGVFVTQKKYDDPFDATMVYSIEGNRGFFRGHLPATYDDCMSLQACFPDHIFPEDYFAFLQIHNGFQKATDSTGILPAYEVEDVFQRLLDLLDEDDILTTRNGSVVNPKTLIPFYESFGLPQYQCFWEEWHHEQGMGNVYYNISQKVISDPEFGDLGLDNLAFPTFSDWLVFYLERID